VAGVVERCDLGAVERQRIGSLSKGYRQRVGLAQALLGDPEVLILDEPTIGLDPRQILEIRRLIKELGGKRTVILSTHILPEVSQTCHRVIIINKGRLVAVDTPANLTAQLQKSARIVVQAAAPAPELARRLGAVRGVASVVPEEAAAAAGAPGSARVVVECERGADPRAELARQVVAAGWDLVELRSVVMTLEDIFIQLVTEEQEVPA
jgi:ABC-2 type transport system ATP-binding protein